MTNYNYHQFLKYVYFEGYADSYQEAESLLEHLTDEEFSQLYSLYESSGMTPENEKTWNRLVREKGPNPFTNPRKSTKSASRREEPTPKSQEKPKSSAVARANRAKVQYKEQYILSHLLDEGYADSHESALAIMINMSEEWKQMIMEREYGDEPTERRFKPKGKGKKPAPNYRHPGPKQGRDYGGNEPPQKPFDFSPEKYR